MRGIIVANLSDEASVVEAFASPDDLVLLARMHEAAAAAERANWQFCERGRGNLRGTR